MSARTPSSPALAAFGLAAASALFVYLSFHVGDDDLQAGLVSVAVACVAGAVSFGSGAVSSQENAARDRRATLLRVTDAAKRYDNARQEASRLWKLGGTVHEEAATACDKAAVARDNLSGALEAARFDADAGLRAVLDAADTRLDSQWNWTPDETPSDLLPDLRQHIDRIR